MAERDTDSEDYYSYEDDFEEESETDEEESEDENLELSLELSHRSKNKAKYCLIFNNKLKRIVEYAG